MPRSFFAATLLAFAIVFSSHAVRCLADDTAPGHSTHGETFDDGPRQAARLMPGVAGPAFNASTKNVEAQKFIDQGIGQLHGFWYWEAERSFRQAAHLDPNCAIAYWGMAAANTNNDTRATGFIRMAVKHKATASPREQQYIDILSTYYEALDKEKNKKSDDKKADDKKSESKEEQKSDDKKTEAKDDEKKDDDKQDDKDKAAETCVTAQREAEQKETEQKAENKVTEKQEAEKKEAARQEEAQKDSVIKEEAKKEAEKKKAAAATPEKKDATADEADLRKRQEELKKQEAELKRKADAAAKKEADAKKKAEETAKKEAKKARYVERQKGWEKLATEFPDDTHARAFLALQLWQDRDTVPIQSHQAIDALLEQVFKLAPNHPAQHYRIHLWDDKRPLNAVTAAAACGQTAPGIAHLWHMPGHTYSKLKRFQDAAYHQEASARVDHAYMLTDRIMPYQIHNFAHNNEWTIRSLHTIGHAHDGLTLALNMLEIPRHPKSNKPFEKNSISGYGRERFYEIAVKYELWPEVLRVADTAYFNEADLPEVDEIRRRRYLAVAAAALGEQKIAAQQIAWFEKLEKELKAGTETKPATPQKPVEQKAEAVSAAADKAKACALLTNAAAQAAVEAAPAKTRTKRETEDLQRRVTESLNHIRGMQAQTAGEYAKSLELLKKVGNLPKEQLVRAHSLADDHKEAVKLAREAVKAGEQAVLPRAALVAALWHAGEREAAGEELRTLRKLAATADADLPAFARLGEVMNDQECPPEWRTKLETPKDIGVRPALETLGPLRWTPATAPNWSLADHEGKQRSLAMDYAGQPVVVIFYLGHGCLHCVEQLQSFAPMTKEFEAAGIKVVGISTDTPEKLRESVKLFTQAEGAFPIPLLTDSEKTAFKQFRCHDDFENRAMHGTFLIDARGRIRWQDIGPEPFNDPKFLLKESQRLLALPE
jgi:peroxiredoxin